MIVRCYGARGSIPVSGPHYIKYGGDTTCLEIRSKNDEIVIVDAGTGIRRLGNRLTEEGRFDFTVFFTHSHMDHISGFPFFKPVYRKQTVIRLEGCPTAQGNIRKILSRAMEAPLFPVPFDALNATIEYSGECSLDLGIDSLEVSYINLSHPNVGRGYKFVEDGKSFVFLTDNELAYRHRNGCSFEDYVEFARDADLLFHDAEYTPEQYLYTRTWGHSTYQDAVRLACTARVKRFGLFHHNQDRTDEEQDAIVDACRAYIRQQGLDMECFGVTAATEIAL